MMWSLKLEWDDAVPEEIKRSFLKWKEELNHLSDLKIPRWLENGLSKPSVQTLHCFCDASKDAYAAVVYLRSESEDDVVVQIVQAKARVAPLKKLTIPRLKLLAATIGGSTYK